jgi:FHS family glucose/mannose:H+ symporter-like MFS transporter
MFALGVVDNGRGPIYPDLLNDFGLNDSRGALFFATTAFFSLFNNLFGTLWLKRLGSYHAFQFFLGLQALSPLAIWLSTSFMGSLVGAAMLGIAMGGLGVTQNILVGEAAPPEKRRQAFAFLHGLYCGSSFVAPIAISALYLLHMTWRASFLCLALPSVLLLIATFFHRPIKVHDEAEAPRFTFTPPERRAVQWIAGTVMMYVMAELLISTRLVLYLRRELGFEVTHANSYLAWFYGLMFVGRVGPALLPRSLPALTVMRLSAAVGSVGLLLGIIWNPLWFLPAGLAMAPWFPATMSYIQEEYGAVRSATFAWVFTLHGTGIMIMHLATGWLTDLFGLRIALGIGPFALGIVSLLLLFPVRIPSK